MTLNFLLTLGNLGVPLIGKFCFTYLGFTTLVVQNMVFHRVMMTL
jgi:hypothetical protein